MQVGGGLFQGRGLGSYSLRVGDVVDNPPHGLVPGVFPAQGVSSDHRKIAAEDSGPKLGVPPPPWRSQCRRQVWRRWRHTYLGVIIHMRSILWHNRLCGSLNVGGNRMVYTWKGRRRRWTHWRIGSQRKRKERWSKYQVRDCTGIYRYTLWQYIWITSHVSDKLSYNW